MEVFKTLNAIDVSRYVEKKDGLSYLSWSNAWEEVKKIYPECDYTIWTDPNTNLPYVYDPNTGYMVFTSVTIGQKTHEMWLPVMDGKNKAMKSSPYKIVNKKGYEYTVQAATMFDINKTIMRCLVKNLAMFGLGLYIYKGEDLPDTGDTEYERQQTTQAPQAVVTSADMELLGQAHISTLSRLIKQKGDSWENVLTLCGINDYKKMNIRMFTEQMDRLTGLPDKK